MLFRSNSENQLVARPGIAHGFLVLSEIAVLNYKSSIRYGETPEYAIDISPFIPNFELGQYIQSERDKVAAGIEEFFSAESCEEYQKSIGRYT